MFHWHTRGSTAAQLKSEQNHAHLSVIQIARISSGSTQPHTQGTISGSEHQKLENVRI